MLLGKKCKNGLREGRVNMTAGEGGRKRLGWERDRGKEEGTVLK